MARKKKIVVPNVLNLEEIVWDDHQMVTRAMHDTDIPQWYSLGVVIYEDEKQVHLGNSLSMECENNAFLEEELSYTQILKPTIVSRKVLMTIPWPPKEDDGTSKPGNP